MGQPYTPPNSTVTYVVPSADESADGPKAFKEFADTIPALGGPISPITRVDADHTITQGDVGGLVVCDTTASDLTLHIENDLTVPVLTGYAVAVVNAGKRNGGQVRIKGGDFVVFVGNGRTVERARVSVFTKIAPNTWLITAGTPDAA